MNTNIAGEAAKSLKSILKLAVQSERASVTKCVPEGKEIVVLGNGPSLAEAISRHETYLRSVPTMAVNFAAVSEQFFQLKPRYYIIIDPLFFAPDPQERMIRLYEAINRVDWKMTLLIPCTQAKLARNLIANPNIKLVTINAIGIEGWTWLRRLAYGRGWGMPRPRNVLGAAIMAAIQMGYKRIRVLGADHTWLPNVIVNDQNQVVSVFKHFYNKADGTQGESVTADISPLPLHQWLDSLSIAFRSYHDIEAYAKWKGVEIINSTPGSYIDAFRREEM